MVDALLVTSSFLPGRGGIESYLAELCKQIAPRLAVLAPGEREGRKLPDDLGYPTIAGPGSMLVPGSRVTKAIAKAAAQLEVDRVVFGTPWPLVLTGPKLKQQGIRYSVIVHGSELLVPSAIPVLRRKLARALADADVLFPVSEFTAGAIRKALTKHGLTAPPLERLGARVDTNRFHPDIEGELRERFDLGSEDKVIVHLGRLVQRKGVHRLIEAIDEIAQRIDRRVVLLVGGTGPQESRLQIEAARRNTTVIMAGRISDEDSPSFYSLGDVFVLPVADRYWGLDTEGLGVVLLEAQACGVPCITGRSGGTVEAVRHGTTGFLIDATDRTELVEKVDYLLQNDEEARRMGAAGRDFVVKTHSHDLSPKPLLDWLE